MGDRVACVRDAVVVAALAGLKAVAIIAEYLAKRFVMVREKRRRPGKQPAEVDAAPHGAAELLDHVCGADMLFLLREEQAPFSTFCEQAHQLGQIAGVDHGAAVAHMRENGRAGGELHKAGEVSLGAMGAVDQGRSNDGDRKMIVCKITQLPLCLEFALAIPGAGIWWCIQVDGCCVRGTGDAVDGESAQEDEVGDAGCLGLYGYVTGKGNIDIVVEAV